MISMGYRHSLLCLQRSPEEDAVAVEKRRNTLAQNVMSLSTRLEHELQNINSERCSSIACAAFALICSACTASLWGTHLGGIAWAISCSMSI